MCCNTKLNVTKCVLRCKYEYCEPKRKTNFQKVKCCCTKGMFGRKSSLEYLIHWLIAALQLYTSYWCGKYCILLHSITYFVWWCLLTLTSRCLWIWFIAANTYNKWKELWLIRSVRTHMPEWLSPSFYNFAKAISSWISKKSNKNYLETLG